MQQCITTIHRPSSLRRRVKNVWNHPIANLGINADAGLDAHHPPPAPSEVEEPRTLESYAKKAPAAPVPALSNEQTPVVASEGATATGGAGDLESEAAQQGAFNEETGEINWDCPCLGGMAHGPCGEEFKAAFSCFVYSKEEPKGVDCIEKFKGMQDCFRAHPDIYGAELEDEEEEGFEGRLPEGEAATALARDGEPSLETVKEGAKEAAKEVDEEVKIKVASVQDDIRQDAQALKTKVEDKLQEKRTDLKEGQETVRKVAQEVSGAKELKSDS